jgi:hypothetical protein
MPSDQLIWPGVALAGLLAIAIGWLLLRSTGARVGMARRLGGAREWKVGELVRAEQLPPRPVRVVGRIRCPDPLAMPSGEQLVAYHRDVEVRLASGRWRAVERLRETRSFELWDHAGSLGLDPAAAAEPLVTIPYVWHGSPQELDDAHRAALGRLTADGSVATAARATTRTIPVIEHLLVLAVARRVDGRVELAPPSGGYVISSVPLDTAMRLLAGTKRRSMALGIGVMTAGAIALLGGLLGTLVGAIG